MYLLPSEIQEYQESGFLLLAERFSPSEVAVMRKQLAVISLADNPGKVIEKDGNTVRSVYGVHVTNPVFKKLCSHPRLYNPARQLVTSDLYVHQFKLNTKAAFDGDVWQWHQDYMFWRNEDGMPEPRAVNAVVFLNDVNEFNGPIYFVPGSQTEGLIEEETTATELTQNQACLAQPAWTSHVSASLKYSLDRAVVARLANQHGIRAPKGPAGSVLFFHCNVLHGSPSNLSPFDRSVAIITYNSTANVPVPNGRPIRPEFLCARNFDPITPLADYESLTGVTL
jgi:ectoine hydroxylase-related dioxygenase (phytanoyl-CoA dioxygenase family)